MPEVKFNLIRPDAINANHAMLDNNSSVMFAKHQDQYVPATNNTMLKPTDVTNAELVNSQEMELMPDKMDNAKPFHNNVMLMVKSN
jgi:hypothetical protein